MIWSLINLAPQAAERAAEQSEATAAGEHIPILVEWVNNLLGPTVYRIQQVIMPTFYSWFGAEWQGDPEMPIPKHMVMFFIAVFISTVILYWLRGKLSVEKPTNRQQSFEILIEGLRSLIKENIGPHGLRYFPMIGMLAVLIGVCNLMGLIPFLEAPTANYNIPIALAFLSFLYYNYIGIKENGLFGYLKHFAGPSAAMAVIFFPVEIISNLVRIVSLSMRLLVNMFGDETLAGAFMQIFAWGLPTVLMPLAVFVALMQSFIFTFLSIIYISEVTHHHEAHEVSITREEGHGLPAEA